VKTMMRIITVNILIDHFECSLLSVQVDYTIAVQFG
jgi:hypothetical protein